MLDVAQPIRASASLDVAEKIGVRSLRRSMVATALGGESRERRHLGEQPITSRLRSINQYAEERAVQRVDQNADDAGATAV